MKNRNPVVSVIIPAYKCAGTIDQAIYSALNQDVELEIIVIDDKSPDSLSDVMAQYQSDERIVYLKNEKNIGAARSRNKGIAYARAPYIAFLDADDCWREGKIKNQLETIKRYHAVLCCTARELMTGEGQNTGHVIPVRNRITYRDILKHNSISCSSVLMKTSVAKEFPMCHEDSHEDYIMWMRVLKKYGYACGINKPYLLYRVSDTGKSGSKIKSATMTWKAYRYMGFGLLQSIFCFICYALNGVWKHYLKK